MRLLVVLFLACSLQAATIRTVCASGCDYTGPQAAVDAAAFGDVIELTAGETFTGGMQLKLKAGTPRYIVIRSSRAGELAGGVRVATTDTAKMAKLQHTSIVVTVEQGASYYRLEGLEIAPTTGNFLYSLVALYPQTATGLIDIHVPADRAHHIIIDRCYVHGIADEDGPRVGAYLETGYTEIVNSWFGEIKDNNGEAKAILNVAGVGPFVFRNNHLEAAAITTLMGGADPTIPGTRTTYASFLGNHYYRPWKWRFEDVSTAPTGTCMWDARGGEFKHDTVGAKYYECQSGTWTEILVGAYPTLTSIWQKNHFELKNASRVVVDGNLIQNAWLPAAQSQKGSAFLFNQVGYYVAGGNYDPYATIKHVLVENNRIENTSWSVSAGGNGAAGYIERIHDIDIRNNLFTGQGGEPFSKGDSVFAQSSQQTDKMRYVNNTIIDASSASGYAQVFQMNASEVGAFSYGMAFSGNIVGFRYSGWRDFGKGNASSRNAIDSQWDYATRELSKNVVVDVRDCSNAQCDASPTTNLKQASDTPTWSGTIPCPSCAVGQYTSGPMDWSNGGTNDVGFEDYAGADYRLAATSPYKGWSHLGQDAGADIDAVEWSTDAVSAGTANPYLDFRVRALTVGFTTADLRYTAYSTAACTPTLSLKPDYSSPVYNTASSTGNRDRLAQVTGLTENRRYFWKIVCDGSYRRSGVFSTMIDTAAPSETPSRTVSGHVIIMGRTE